MAKGTVNFEPSGSADDQEFARSSTPSKYENLIHVVCGLNHRQTVTLSVKRGDDLEKARLRVRQALNRYVPTHVRDYKRFEVRKSVRGTIVVVAILLSRDS